MPNVLVPKTDIDLIVSAFIQTGAAADLYGEDVDLTRVGRILWRENLAAAREDLPGRDWTGEERAIDAYAFYEHVGISMGPLTCVVYAYEAESCEHDGWRKSEACAIVHALYRTIACAAPNARKGPWGVRRPEDLATVCPSAPAFLPDDAGVRICPGAPGGAFLDALFPSASTGS